MVDPLTSEQIKERSIRAYASHWAYSCGIEDLEAFIAITHKMLSELIDLGLFAFDAEAPEAPEESKSSDADSKALATRAAELFIEIEAELKLLQGTSGQA